MANLLGWVCPAKPHSSMCCSRSNVNPPPYLFDPQTSAIRRTRLAYKKGRIRWGWPWGWKGDAAHPLRRS